MDAETAEFVRSAQRFLNAVMTELDGASDELTPLGHAVQEHLGVALDEVDPVIEHFPVHQTVDLDLALAALIERHGGRQHGVAGRGRAHQESFAEYLRFAHWRFALGPVSYARMPTGPDSDRRVVAFGLGLLRRDGVPVAFLQRSAAREYGREDYTLELLCPDRAAADAFLAEVRALMAERSILRGQVISFQKDDFDYHASGNPLTFLARPRVSAEQVILPEGVLERVTRHVVGIGERVAELRAAGQHVKRGVLLYGPPGTGKTHLVRHLLTLTPGTTAVLLSGRSLGALNEATKLARVAQPAIIVLEDCDLVAEERGGETNAMLFETLEAMDGLAGDADITFILTTNRPDLLERALIERPGRVDLAISIDKPDRDARRRLFALYAGELIRGGQLSAGVADRAADRTEGVTASFVKEVVRRAVLDAGQDGRSPADDDLLAALDEMLSDAEALTRTLLGGGSPDEVPATWSGFPAWGSDTYRNDPADEL